MCMSFYIISSGEGAITMSAGIHVGPSVSKLQMRGDSIVVLLVMPCTFSLGQPHVEFLWSCINR